MATKRKGWKNEAMLWRGAWLALKVNLTAMREQPQVPTIGQIERMVTELGNRVLNESEQP